MNPSENRFKEIEEYMERVIKEEAEMSVKVNYQPVNTFSPLYGPRPPVKWQPTLSEKIRARIKRFVDWCFWAKLKLMALIGLYKEDDQRYIPRILTSIVNHTTIKRRDK